MRHGVQPDVSAPAGQASLPPRAPARRTAPAAPLAPAKATAAEPPHVDSEEFVRSLARGLAVIRVFDASHRMLSLSEVAERAGISRAAARRFLMTLETLGYVRSRGRLFALAPRVLDIGSSYLSALHVPEVSQPHLERLARDVGEAVSATVLDGLEVVYVARSANRRILDVTIGTGTRFPAHATAVGRVLIAALPEPEWEQYLAPEALTAYTAHTRVDPVALREELRRVRARGWAMVEDELEEGLRSVSVPVRLGGEVAVAINIASGPARDRSAGTTARDVRALLATARAIETDLR